jgi:ABC-2 type transport system permease protein
MRKIWLIARREYWYNFRRRAFLFTAFGVPAFSLLMMFVVFALIDTTMEATGTLGAIGYVDGSGVLDEPVELPEEYVAYPDEDAALEALLTGDIGACFVVAEDYLSNGQVDAYGRDSIPEGIEDQFEDFLQANVARMVPAAVPVERLLQPMGGLTIVSLGDGDELSEPEDFAAAFLKPFVFALVFLMATTTTSQFLLSGVVEEKENRMMEILATSCAPLQLLWGKVLGLGVLGLTQVVIWAVAGTVLLGIQGEDSLLSGISYSADYLLISLVYFVLGYFLFAAIMAGIGASVTAEQEGRQFAGLFTFIAVLPMVLSISFLDDPNGTLPVVFSLFPLTSPLSIIMRIPMGIVPTWQIVTSLVILVVSMVGLIWLAARVFRLGMLMYGKRLTIREIVSALRQGRRAMTTVAHTEEG